MDAPVGVMSGNDGGHQAKIQLPGVKNITTPAKMLLCTCLASSLQRRRREVLDTTCQASPGLT